MNSPNAQIAVLYLARKTERLNAFRAFIHSYTTYSAGIDHDLVVIFKGYEGGSDFEEAHAEFADLPHISIEMPDKGFDLGSYLSTANLLTHEYICCFNTFSKILADNWLKKLHSHVVLPDMGIVGATGSYEGNHDVMTIIQKAIWLNSQPTLNPTLRYQLNKYFEFVFRHTFPNTDAVNSITKKISTMLSMFQFMHRHLFGCIGSWKNSRNLERNYIKWWNETKKIGDIANFCKFPSFPNPHIRSNAFMINRKRLLNFEHSSFH